jgi:hypothetical protein
MSKMEGRGNLFLLFFFCPLPEFSNVGSSWNCRKFYDVRSFFQKLAFLVAAGTAANFVVR